MAGQLWHTTLITVFVVKWKATLKSVHLFLKLIYKQVSLLSVFFVVCLYMVLELINTS